VIEWYCSWRSCGCGFVATFKSTFDVVSKAESRSRDSRRLLHFHVLQAAVHHESITRMTRGMFTMYTKDRVFCADSTTTFMGRAEDSKVKAIRHWLLVQFAPCLIHKYTECQREEAQESRRLSHSRRIEPRRTPHMSANHGLWASISSVTSFHPIFSAIARASWYIARESFAHMSYTSGAW
jgi:hypothetical protein